MSKIQIMTDSASRVDFGNEQFFGLMAQYDDIPKTARITPLQI